MPYRLKDIDVKFISLVRAGANRRKIIWKGEDTIDLYVPISKVEEEKRVVYGVVYAPDEVDTQGDFTTAEEIEKAAYRFMKNLRLLNVDKNHDYDPKEAFVCESWLVRKGDPLFPDEKEGAWAVGIKVEDDEMWEQVKKGEITGLSMAGEAIREPVEKGYKKATEDTPWRFNAADYTVEELARASAWVRGVENPHSDPIPKDLTKSDCKLPHHLPDGTLVWRGVVAAGNALQGARGGVDIPSEDLPRVRRHLERHYHEFGKKAPWEQEKSAFRRIFNKIFGGKDMDEREIKELISKAIDEAFERREKERKDEEFRKSVEERDKKIDELVKSVDELKKKVEELEKAGKKSGPADNPENPKSETSGIL